jgi:hypothetical protein
MGYSYLFSKNNKIGSKLISWSSGLFKKDITELSGRIPSHVAVLINECLVIESTLGTGVRIIPYNKWKEINEELFKIDCIQSYDDLEDKKKELLFEMWGKKYDWWGILYFTKCMLSKYFFNIPLPSKNKLEREDYFFCTEFAARLAGYDYSMTTPAKMCNDFLRMQK